MGQFIRSADSFQFKAFTNDILKAIMSEAQWLSLIKSLNKDIGVLTDIIQKEAKNSDSEGFKIPSIKALSNDVGLTSAKVSKYIYQLYDDLSDYLDCCT
jgi:hypothetical protein